MAPCSVVYSGFDVLGNLVEYAGVDCAAAADAFYLFGIEYKAAFGYQAATVLVVEYLFVHFSGLLAGRNNPVLFYFRLHCLFFLVSCVFSAFISICYKYRHLLRLYEVLCLISLFSGPYLECCFVCRGPILEPLFRFLLINL